jgi:hypothetical protein
MMLKIHYNNEYVLPYARILISKMYIEIKNNYKENLKANEKKYIEGF